MHAVPLPTPAPAGAVIPLSATELADAAAIIDRLVDASLADAKQKANPRTTDEQFPRRAYPSLVGRIPTADEAQAFPRPRSSLAPQARPPRIPPPARRPLNTLG